MAQHLRGVSYTVYGPYGDEYEMPQCDAPNARSHQCHSRATYAARYTGEPWQFLCTHHKQQALEWVDGGIEIHTYTPEDEWRLSFHSR